MINTADIRDWLDAQKIGLVQVLNGPLTNTSREKLMSVSRAVIQQQRKPLGGYSNSGYDRIACNCILHWNDSYKDTEAKTIEIRDLLLSADRMIINGHRVALVNLRNIVDIGKDENDIFEFAIDFEFIYNRSKELEGE